MRNVLKGDSMRKVENHSSREIREQAKLTLYYSMYQDQEFRQ